MYHRRIDNLFILLFIGFLPGFLMAQKSSKKQDNLVFMDKQGVLRYTSGKAEAAFFGVNYTTPFAHAYRAHKAMNTDLEQAIRNDVYHFARLGFDAFRVHVWDTEISDTAGNLIENEHLRLFDFLLAELKKRNIKTIVTPIAFWGNGYPERDEPTPGFARKYGKGGSTSNDTAIRAQENYIRQFFKHVNPYTKLTYEEDKHIIAAEINNEPSHSNPKQKVTEYINRLTVALKSTGWTKPVFYNISQGPYFSDAVAASVVDGFSFQWYPSGLVANREQKGNFLPHVDTYRIPFRDTVPAFANKALMVYEFDAADIFQPYIYPAMAKSFRQSGFQWATQFAYDPMAMANVNTEYQTHYLNLAYTPAKAISMLIASEVFHRLPRMKSFGTYPADSVFDVFRVSYASSLSEMNSPEKFYYSNSTSTIPADKRQLKKIAGVGNSAVVHYGGTGAYFLDKLEDGVWYLEVMPDVIHICDPFERASPKKQVTLIRYRTNSVKITLQDLGTGFSILGINQGNNFNGPAKENEFQASPGTYILTRAGKTYNGLDLIRTQGKNEFAAPPESAIDIQLRHEPLTEVSSGKPVSIQAILGAADSARLSIQLTRLGGGLFRNIPMKQEGPYLYIGEIPADLVTTGQLHYRIIVQDGNNYVSFPGGIKGNPFAWDNFENETWKINVAAANASLELFNAATDRNVSVHPNFRRGFQAGFISGDGSGSLLYRLNNIELRSNDVMGMQWFVGNKVQQRSTETDGFAKVVIRARGNTGKNVFAKLALINKYGAAWSAPVTLNNELQEIELPLNIFTPDSSLLMPRPYPDFQPLWFKSSYSGPLHLSEVERIELTTGSYLPQQTDVKSLGIELEWVRLKK